MALSQVYRLQFQYRVQDKLCSWGAHYECSAGTDPDNDASDLAAEFQSVVVSQVLAALAPDVTFEGIYVSCVVPSTALPHSVNGESTPGSYSGADSVPANLCAVFSLQTTNPLAVRQGRLYFSGISRDALVSGLWDQAFVSGELQSIATALVANLTPGAKTFKPVILQRVVGGAPITPRPLDISAVTVRAIPYTQRRRTTRQIGSAA